MFLNVSSVEEVLGDINIPFDCEFLIGRQGEDGAVTLTEVYRTGTGRQILNSSFGYWLSKMKFKFPSTNFYSRRFSLHGLSIAAATNEVWS
jgi:hypothetical protein